MKAVVESPSEDLFPLYDITLRLTRTLTVLTEVSRRFLQPLEKSAGLVALLSLRLCCSSAFYSLFFTNCVFVGRCNIWATGRLFIYVTVKARMLVNPRFYRYILAFAVVRW